MEEFVPFDPNVHMEEFYQMNIESMTWHQEQALQDYQVDLLSILGINTIKDLVDGWFEDFAGLKPPEGIVYIIEVDGEVAGMGALRKVSDDTGALYRMYTRPQYRRRGFARQMLEKLMEAGRELGCSTFWLRTPKFSVAPHLYRSVGFEETDYPESMRMNPKIQPYWFFMEKTE